MPESNSGNSGRQSHQSVTRPSSFGSLQTGDKEPIYFNCSAHTFSKKVLKDEDNFTVEGVENFIKKAPRVHPVTYELLFLEDRIKFKGFRPALRNERHQTVLYSQIKGAYAVLNYPNLLVLAIDYSEKRKRKYESFLFSNSQVAAQVKSILLVVKQDPEHLVRGYESIGRTSTSSLLLPSVTGNPQAVKPVGSAYSVSSTASRMEEKATSFPDPEVKKSKPPRYFSSQSTSPIVQQILYEEAKKHEDKSRNIMAIHEAPLKLSRDYHSLNDLQEGQENSEDLKLKIGQMRGSLDGSCGLINELECQWPGSVIYLNNDGDQGIHIVDDGPIYMYCQHEF